MPFSFDGLKCWHCLPITWFRSAFLHLSSKILRILRVELIVPSYLRNSLTYALIKDSSGLTLLYIKSLKSYVMMSTIGADHPMNFPSPPKIMFSKNLRYNPKEVSKSLPRIISYLLLVDLATWHLRVTILVTPNSGRVNSTFIFIEVVNFLAWVSHVVSV